MKNNKIDILINKYSKINLIKNKIKKYILFYYFQNLNLNLKNRQIIKLIVEMNFTKINKKNNICLFSARKKNINSTLGLGRHKINKLIKLGSLDSYSIHK